MKRPTSLASTISVDNSDGISINSGKRRRISPITSSWTVTDPPVLPYLYLKEKTSVVVLNDSPQTIADRILLALKALNCVGEFNVKKSKATMTASEGTVFCVQFFRVTEKANECVIVEMQRMNGSPIVFHSIARHILRVAKKLTFAEPSSGRKEKISIRSRRLPQQESGLFPRTIEIVLGLLNKDRLDAQLLGIESMRILTSARSSSDSMIAFASNIVLNGGDFGEVRDTLYSLISAQSTNKIDEFSEDAEVEYSNKMRIGALSTLANALEASSDNLKSLEKWTGEEGLISTLLVELKNSDKNPHEAYLATKILCSTLEKSLELREYARERGVLSALQRSQEVGYNTYYQLGNESNRLLQILQ